MKKKNLNNEINSRPEQMSPPRISERHFEITITLLRNRPFVVYHQKRTTDQNLFHIKKKQLCNYSLASNLYIYTIIYTYTRREVQAGQATLEGTKKAPFWLKKTRYIIYIKSQLWYFRLICFWARKSSKYFFVFTSKRYITIIFAFEHY